MSDAPSPWMIQGLIFDLDGVLIQSSECHRQAFEDVLADFGISGFSYSRFAGWRTAEVFRVVFQENLRPVSEERILECGRRKSARARELLAEGNPIPSDCISVLCKLSGKYRLGLASSGSRQSVEGFLERTGTRGLFHSVLSGDDVCCAKPDPEIVLRSVRALELTAEACAFIDDAVAGVQAGRAAGVCAVGFGTENAAALIAAGADFVVGSLTAIADWLDAL